MLSALDAADKGGVVKVPSEFEDIFICDRAGCNWLELQEYPQYVVEQYRLLMRAEAMKAKRDYGR